MIDFIFLVFLNTDLNLYAAGQRLTGVLLLKIVCYVLTGLYILDDIVRYTSQY